jgi:hypothetical protein
MKKINVARFFKDDKFTGGWLEIKEETLNIIINWIMTPGCRVEFDETTTIGD